MGFICSINHAFTRNITSVIHFPSRSISSPLHAIYVIKVSVRLCVFCSRILPGEIQEAQNTIPAWHEKKKFTSKKAKRSLEILQQMWVMVGCMPISCICQPQFILYFSIQSPRVSQFQLLTIAPLHWSSFLASGAYVVMIFLTASLDILCNVTLLFNFAFDWCTRYWAEIISYYILNHYC